MKKENFEEFDENEHDNDEHKTDEEPKRNGKGRKGRKKKKEQTDTDKLPLATMEQLRQALSMMIVSRFNGITMKPEVRWLGDSLDPFSQSTIVTDGDGEYGNEWHDLNDREVNTLYQCCSHYYRCNIKDIEAIINSHFTHLTDPICDWLDHNSLANFFDTDHDYIKDVADHVHIRPTGGQTQQEAQQEWTECFRRWLVGMVRGILLRGVTNQTVLTLIGEQGAYKSTFFRNLLPPELRRYFYVKTDNTVINKDDRLQMTCNWLICLEEIDSLSRKEQNQLKAMITLETVQDRPAYARYFEVRRRICSFCATGNNEHFLNDPTGSRRWSPSSWRASTTPTASTTATRPSSTRPTTSPWTSTSATTSPARRPTTSTSATATSRTPTRSWSSSSTTLPCPSPASRASISPPPKSSSRSTPVCVKASPPTR